MHHIQAKLSILRCARCIDTLGYERSVYANANLAVDLLMITHLFPSALGVLSENSIEPEFGQF